MSLEKLITVGLILFSHHTFAQLPSIDDIGDVVKCEVSGTWLHQTLERFEFEASGGILSQSLVGIKDWEKLYSAMLERISAVSPIRAKWYENEKARILKDVTFLSGTNFSNSTQVSGLPAKCEVVQVVREAYNPISGKKKYQISKDTFELLAPVDKAILINLIAARDTEGMTYAFSDKNQQTRSWQYSSLRRWNTFFFSEQFEKFDENSWKTYVQKEFSNSVFGELFGFPVRIHSGLSGVTLADNIKTIVLGAEVEPKKGELIRFFEDGTLSDVTLKDPTELNYLGYKFITDRLDFVEPDVLKSARIGASMVLSTVNYVLFPEVGSTLDFSQDRTLFKFSGDGIIRFGDNFVKLRKASHIISYRGHLTGYDPEFEGVAKFTLKDAFVAFDAKDIITSTFGNALYGDNLSSVFASVSGQTILGYFVQKGKKIQIKTSVTGNLDGTLDGAVLAFDTEIFVGPNYDELLKVKAGTELKLKVGDQGYIVELYR